VGKKINKFSLQELYIDDLQSGLLALTGVSRDKLLFNIFGLVPPGVSEEKLRLSEDEEKRLLFIKEIVHSLKGSYNARGIRQWFLRAFVQLDNKKPCYILYRDTWKQATRTLKKFSRLQSPSLGHRISLKIPNTGIFYLPKRKISYKIHSELNS
jgi:hypothetical protein